MVQPLKPGLKAGLRPAITEQQSLEEEKTEIVKSLCGMCPVRCGIDVYVKSGMPARIRPMPEHFANLRCVKGAAWTEMFYHPERLLRPKMKADGGWKFISWDKALDDISTRLLDIKKKYGPESLAIYHGAGYAMTDAEAMMYRLGDVFGTPNILGATGLCMGATFTAGMLTFGNIVMPSFGASRCILLFGYNPSASSLPAERTIQRRRRAGETKLIVVDPRTTPLARMADIHAKVRPGSDGALALGMLNVIIGEGLYDREFVAKWTTGFDKLAERVKEYPPQRVEQITWVPAETIAGMARMYATSRPASLYSGVGAEQNTNAVQTTRAIASLIAVTGNYDVPGGNRSHRYFNFARIAPEKRAAARSAVGADRYPLFWQRHRMAHWSVFTEGILREKPYPIRALLVFGGNPALNFPASAKIREAFEKLELLVVHDNFVKDTGPLADYVLPLATYLECTEAASQIGLPLITLQNQAVEPMGDCWSISRFITELAKRLGYGQYFNWASDEERLDELMSPEGITVEQLRKSPGGVFYMGRPDRAFERTGLLTPSGKVELYSSTLEKMGHDPLPGYKEPAESPFSQPEMTKEYPLVLTTGARLVAFTHSYQRNIPSLLRREPFPKVEINPETAARFGIQDSDDVVVETPRGSIKVRACVTEDIVAGAVQITHGWSKANVNELTDGEQRDPILGYPSLRALLCRLRKA
ncbi:MAG: molybdopterin-dependent oxidoreductase [Chloroflexi bacterium]|nr:molybdopterin-dependent oxidoreductase [Chloroflexota bacterium]